MARHSVQYPLVPYPKYGFMAGRGTVVFVLAEPFPQTKVVLYPHGGNPHLLYEIWKPHPFVDAILAPSEGHANVLRDTGITKPIFNIGWCLSPVRPMQHPPGNDILFAPVHPDMVDHLPERERKANCDIFWKLRAIGHPLTVRYVGSLEANGIPKLDGVTYQKAAAVPMLDAIMKADVVIASGTFAFVSVAMGKPTIMFEQGLGSSESSEPFPNLANYPYMLYPWDAEDLSSWMLEAVKQPRDSVKQWRDLFIGREMDGDGLVKVLEDICSGE